jgi:S-adenosylmethionine:tRNA ribosyltransferase-isomerase
MTLTSRPLDFVLPRTNIAREPAEQRGWGRDDVRLMVTKTSVGTIEHDRFSLLGRHLLAGDMLVVNTSATLPAALDARTSDGETVKVHIASPAPGGLWAVELRTPTPEGGTAPSTDIAAQTLRLPAGVEAHLLAKSPRTPRLWIASIETRADMASFLMAHGEPIRYVDGPHFPIGSYQTIFADEPGSAEMPSAGRPFTHAIISHLIGAGVVVTPLVLHTGVSSYEDHENPAEERYSVPESTADVINALRSEGGRLIAVGTTVVRALESVADESGTIHPGQGVTDLVITPERGIRAVDGMLTGWHEPRSSHLRMLEAFLSRSQLEEVYRQAIESGYLWHEFGDGLLILP